MKIFIYTVIGIVVAAIVAGFVIVGSPQNKRMQRIDERRINDLSSIQWQVVSYWQNKARVPENLNVLKDDLSGFVVPVDPETKAPYEYAKTGDLSFKLCATFAEATSGDPNSYDKHYSVPFPIRDGNWEHGAGYACFERTIDPDLYKPVR